MLFKPDFRFIPCAIHINPLKEKWVFCWSGYLSWRKLHRKNKRVKYENLCEYKSLLDDFETKKFVQRTIFQRSIISIYTFDTIILFYFSIDYYGYQSNSILHFQDGYLFDNKDALGITLHRLLFYNRN